MISRKRPREFWIVAAILLAALVIRLIHVGWGLPFVYEEATPLKEAWAMGSWGSPQGIDLNPHFFNYPSLTIYLQFIAQVLLFLAMKLGGLVDSGVAYHARYLVDPTPFYYTGRLISVLFGVATVWMTYLVVRRVSTEYTAGIAAALLAVNTYHVSRSHLVEVDVPLTFFIVLAFWLLLRCVERPTIRNYLLSGVAIGLAASTKYTGAMMLLPLAVAYLLARRRDPSPSWVYPLVSLAAAVTVFLMTSPYVVLDAGTFSQHLSVERQHMKAGHFGLTGSSSWRFYIRSLSGTVMGIPAVVLSAAGLVYATAVRRKGPALVVAAFVLPYLLAVSTWSMRADRYMLPVLPPLLVFAALAAGSAANAPVASRWPRAARSALAALLAVVMAAPVVAAYPTYIRGVKTDTRTTSAEWIEGNIPSGSYLVVEPYGPEVLGPVTLASVNNDVRDAALLLLKGRANYAVLQVPMFQVAPERSEVFYDHALYENADYFVSTGAVRSRYTKEPGRFPLQNAFYDSLETGFEKVAEFQPGDGGGSVIAVFKSPLHRQFYGERKSVAPPRALSLGRFSATGAEDLFYYSLGINYEVFLHLEEAVASYDMAFRYPVTRPASFKNLALRKTQCLMNLGRPDDALAFLDRMIPEAPTPEIRRQLTQVRSFVVRRQATGNRRQ